MAKLRLETSQAHNSIEQSPSMRAIFSDGYSLQHYRTLLHALWKFYVPLEAEVFDKLPRDIATKFEHRRKSAWLAADLSALGVALSPMSAWSVPQFRSFEECMGALYVTEGATLGGKLIRKRLLGHFGQDIEGAIAFYSGYGKRASAEWQDFRAQLDALFDQAETAVQEKVVAGANATFSALERWLEPLNDPSSHGEAAVRTV